MSVSTFDTPLVAVSLFLKNMESLRGIPYLWGGKDPHGLDCSGAITYALLQSGGPDLREFHNAQKLSMECNPSKPIDYKYGMLAFYGMSDRNVDHVMCVFQGPNGSMVAYGACGGNHYTTSKEQAIKIGAMVKDRPRIAYRHDFLFAGTWPYLDYTK